MITMFQKYVFTTIYVYFLLFWILLIFLFSTFVNINHKFPVFFSINVRRGSQRDDCTSVEVRFCVSSYSATSGKDRLLNLSNLHLIFNNKPQSIINYKVLCIMWFICNEQKNKYNLVFLQTWFFPQQVNRIIRSPHISNVVFFTI